MEATYFFWFTNSLFQILKPSFTLPFYFINLNMKLVNNSKGFITMNE